MFATFDVGSAFYVAESDVPSRVLKVVVDESYIPERLTEEYADFDINCRTLDSVFWESKYTTLELHDSGYSATAEKYGLVDNIDDEKVHYRFEPEILETVFNNPSQWESGSINSTNGSLTDSDSEIRMTNYIDTIPGMTYRLEETQSALRLRQWWVIHYDSSGNYLGFSSTPWGGPKEMEFTALGERIKIRSGVITGETLSSSDIGANMTPVMSVRSINNNFTVYNAGNVTVEPESMDIRISLSSMRTYDNNLTIKNLTTGESHIFENGISGGTTYVIEGVTVSQNQVNRFRDTNKRFISLAPGDNEFEVNGATYGEIRFEFKYLYK